MAKRGPKEKFNEKIKSTIIRLLKDGKTEAQVAEIIGVSPTTISNWKGRHVDLLYAVREAKLTADELVVASLFQRAVGYSHPEEKVFNSDKFGITTHETVKHYPPDTQAAMFWLRNRQPDRWGGKLDSDVIVNNTTNTNALTDEQLDARIAALVEKAKK